jgi:hypothetical protein
MRKQLILAGKPLQLLADIRPSDALGLLAAALGLEQIASAVLGPGHPNLMHVQILASRGDRAWPMHAASPAEAETQQTQQ